MGGIALLAYLFLGNAMAQDLPDYLKAPPAKTHLSLELLGQLKRGGYIIFFRHGKTVTQPSFDGAPGFIETDYDNCATQRNLSKEGRDQAIALGNAFRALEIPLGIIRSSPYCRTRDTAWLAFGRVEKDVNLLLKSNNPDLDPEEAQNWRNLRALAKQIPMAGTNSIYVTHASAAEVFGGTVLQEGEAVILLPDTGDGAKIIAQIKVDGWVDQE